MSLLGDNKLKLGVFASNLDGGLTATTARERHRLSWDTVARVARQADEAGFELQVPLARWRGLGGVTNFNGCNYEPLTWAAGVSAVTARSNVFATVHVPVLHPLVAAKQMTTVDHISNGRFGLNLVCGWFPAEFAMFGSPMMDHDARYAYAAEWLAIVRRLWNEEEEFDFEGRFFRIEKGMSQPKPLRRPPPIMNAGQSPTGARFAAEHADIAFLSISESEPFDAVRAKFANLRRLAREEFKREIEIWTGCWVICRSSEREALAYRDYCLREHGDPGAVDGLPKEVLPPKGTPPEVLEQFRFKAMAGFGGVHVVGSPQQVVERMREIASLGADGIVLSWVNYEEGIADWVRDVMPGLEAEGLRRPAAPSPR
ncbi:MAG TPA: LLM class flavin-dependent oxidoreductase [Steroidobacteraceae bacterium]|nr:LLM class flavin-dependent oxidoreductase [Steroidobacteraceae bacterium]